jgi:hypothetical protein
LPRRPLLLGALVLALGVACVVVWRGADGAAPAPRRPRAAGPTTTANGSTREAVAVFDVPVGDRTGCQTLGGPEPQLLCPLPDGVVEYLQVSSPLAAYARAIGPTRPHGETTATESACARGEPEERPWATPTEPEVVAGRYLCRVEGGRADLWWTVDDARLLGHAFRRDGDVSALFTWWRGRREGDTDHP